MPSGAQLPEFQSSVKLKYVKLAYQYLVNNMLSFILIPTITGIVLELAPMYPNEILALLNSIKFDTIQLLSSVYVILILTTVYLMSRPRPVYLVDYALFKASPRCRVPFSSFMEHLRLINNDKKSVEFQARILGRSGLGEETWLPPATHCLPPSPTMEASWAEARLTIFSAINGLIKKTGLMPKDIDILVVNCSLFSPTPSLSAMIVNEYKLRSNIRSFNLSGMGCSAGLLSISLARDLLQAHPNSNALVISTEIITPNYYFGNERAMLLPNCLFRMGAAAILLSNRRSERRRAKYRLIHLVRTHKGEERHNWGADDKAYRCVYEEEDSQGYTGISLSKDLMAIAGDALKANISTMGPLVLPASEQLLFLFNLVGRRLINPKWRPYIPDFKQAFEHFCIHAGGRAVIDELQKSLQLSAEHVEASRMTLHRFGNTSSSSLWYELNYIESKGRMNKGDRVWQIGFGSGFKCNSAVWKCMRTLQTPVDGPWADCINSYPVEIPLKNFVEYSAMANEAALSSMVISLLMFSFLGGHSQSSLTLVPAIITFGDSTVDVGNNDYLPFSVFKANFPPYGRDFVNHQPTGRFCNGKLATDFTAETLGFSNYAPAYLSPQASGKNLLLGANFASAASGYFEKTALLYHAIPLSQQLEYYKEYQSKLSKVAGKSQARSILSGALYIVSAGSGDFVQNYYINPYLNKIYTPDQFSSILIENFSDVVKSLYGLGARKIGVTSLPPMGCLPASISLFGFGSNNCVSRLNTDAQGFNRKLNAVTKSLVKKYPKLKIVVLDIYTPLYDLATAPSKHGFFESRKGCCGTGTVETSVLCNPKSPGTCSNATGYVFWDGVHPSQAANQVIADSLLLQGISLIG